MDKSYKFTKLDKAAAVRLLKAMQAILEGVQEQHNLMFDLMIAVKDNNVKEFLKHMDNLNCDANLRNQFDWEPLLQLTQTYEKITGE